MQLSFHGAAGEVTGSCSLLETNDLKILVDCGMFQGNSDAEYKNSAEFSFDPKSLSAVIVTHAHLDHVGRLPLLVKHGFGGFFYSTPPTKDLTRLILEDAFSVMEYDNRHFGRPLLYTMEDVEGVMGQFKTIEYRSQFTIENEPSAVKKMLGLHKLSKKVSGVEVTFRDAGHIFGSAFVEIRSEGKKIVFSGDVGNVNVPILKDTEDLPKDIDLLVCESTYGDRRHESSEERENMLRDVVIKTGERGGVLMIPSFALERTQELLYELNDLIDRHHSVKTMPIYLDSPLAIDTLKVFKKYPEYYDTEAAKFIKDGDDIFDFEGLTLTYTRDESMKINHTMGSKVVIAGAGMMNGGRIMHHALRYLSDHRNALLIIGYQSPGTLGWKILNGAPKVDILKERVSVNCEVKMINAFSAHGDKDKIFNWVYKGGPKRIVLNHGDKPSATALSELFKMHGMNAEPADVENIITI